MCVYVRNKFDILNFILFSFLNVTFKNNKMKFIENIDNVTTISIIEKYVLQWAVMYLYKYTVEEML